MKLLILLVPICVLISCKPSDMESNDLTSSSQEEYGFDETLAAELSADDYGMAQYVMAFLYKGPNRSLDSLESAQLQRAHLDNMKTWVADNKLALAGPFLEEGDLRGIYIFVVSSVEEARRLTETDPAIIAGSLRMELKPWYGSAALKMVSKMHSQVAKKEI